MKFVSLKEFQVLEQQLKVLREQYRNELDRTEIARISCNKIEEQTNLLSDQFIKTQGEHDKLKKENSELSSAITQNIYQIEQLKIELAGLETDQIRAIKQNKELGGIIDDLKEEIKELDINRIGLREKNYSLALEVFKKDTKLKELETEARRAENDFKISLKNIEVNEKVIDDKHQYINDQLGRLQIASANLKAYHAIIKSYYDRLGIKF